MHLLDRLDRIPEELRGLERWMVWRPEKVKER